MTFFSDAAAGILAPEQVGELVIRPIQQQSVAMQVCTVAPTGSPRSASPWSMRTPPPWVPEGFDIDLTDPR